MPAAVPLLAAIGGGSALAGGAALLGTGAALYGANRDRKTASENQQLTAQERGQSLGYIQDQTRQAQDFLGGSLNPQLEALKRGYGGALEATRGGAALQLDAISQGNQDAQRMLLGGLPFIQQALMGQPMDMAALVPMVQQSRMNWNQSAGMPLIEQYAPRGAQAPQPAAQAPQMMQQAPIDWSAFQQYFGGY